MRPGSFQPQPAAACHPCSQAAAGHMQQPPAMQPGSYYPHAAAIHVARQLLAKCSRQPRKSRPSPPCRQELREVRSGRRMCAAANEHSARPAGSPLASLLWRAMSAVKLLHQDDDSLVGMVAACGSPLMAGRSPLPRDHHPGLPHPSLCAVVATSCNAQDVAPLVLLSGAKLVCHAANPTQNRARALDLRNAVGRGVPCGSRHRLGRLFVSAHQLYSAQARSVAHKRQDPDCWPADHCGVSSSGELPERLVGSDRSQGS